MDVRDSILDHLKSIDRKLAWLARETGINYHSLYSTLKLKDIKLSQAKLELINKVLNTDFKL